MDAHFINGTDPSPFSKEVFKRIQSDYNNIKYLNLTDSLDVKPQFLLDIRNDDIIVINCELVNPYNNKRSDFNGIKLLKWLRINGVQNFCILYSFLPLSQLIRFDPLNSILHSKGVGFLQLPSNETAIINILNSKECAVKENLIPFFRAEVDLSKIRHDLANQWGAIRISSLLGIDRKANSSYHIQLLTYISSTELKEIPRLKKLAEVIEDVKSVIQNSKKFIVYYDDQKEIWRPILNELFGADLVVCHSPDSMQIGSFINYVSEERKKIGCILLDLRLENEHDFKENVLSYSGGKVLKQLKDQFVTLPIIMFTASNKAETLRQLMEAGAEYVWTKEGVDDGINNNITIYNTIKLLEEVNKCFIKYQNEYYETIYKAEYEMLKIRQDNIIPISQTIISDGTDIFLDTNYLIDTVKNDCFSNFYKFLLAVQMRNKIKIIVHTDVFDEIQKYSREDENKENIKNGVPNNDNQYLVPICRFLIKKLIEFRYCNLIWEEWIFGRESSIRDISSFRFNSLTPIEVSYKEKGVFSTLKGIFDKREREAEMAKKNLLILANNIMIEEYNTLLPYLKLYADRTFKKIIPDRFKIRNIIFVSSDNDCSCEIGMLILKQYNTSIDINNKRTTSYNDSNGNSREILVHIKIGENTYRRHNFKSFNNMLFL